jgi:hypothetical protein
MGGGLRSSDDSADSGTQPEDEGVEMSRYLLIVNFEGGVVDTPMEEWKPQEITAHLDYYKALHRELVASGELVQSEVLTGPDLAKIVTSEGTAPVVTDGRSRSSRSGWPASRSSMSSRRRGRSRSPRRSPPCQVPTAFRCSSRSKCGR